MSKYCRHIELSRWDELKSHFVKLLDKATPAGEVFLYEKGSPEFDLITELIFEDIRSLMRKSFQIHHAMLVIQPSKNIKQAPIHVDGLGDNDPIFPKHALNIPIHNCEQGEMIWYEGDYEMEVRHGQADGITNGVKAYMGVKWRGEPVKVESKIIDTPHIVKINTPHQIINHSDDYRMIMTVRIVPDFRI